MDALSHNTFVPVSDKSLRRRSAVALAAATTLLCSLSVAAEGEKPAANEERVLKVNGLYTIWGHTQRQFLLGRDHPLDEADFVTQMLRAKVTVGKPAFGVIARLDAAQGWWGANNAPNTYYDGDGKPMYNPGAFFRNKDTNYPVHVDWGYLYVDIPRVPVRVQAGRQYFGVGNKLVLDEDYDGVIVTVKQPDVVSVDLMWAKISEGRGSFKLPAGKLMSDDGVFGDADMLGGRAFVALGPVKSELFGLYYRDKSDGEDASGVRQAYLPQGLGYFRSRFAPQVSSLIVVGLSLKGAHKSILDGLSYKLEVDYLTGKDNIDNADYAGNAIDKNNGDIGGYNVYAEVVQKLTAGVKMDVALKFGMGSGDKDVSGGKGNVNKIQTMGFFSLNNVWEDSVMPDVAGIAPQGLGSPVSRGYRELENTTAVVVALGVSPWDPLHLQVSGTYLRATEPVGGWDTNGPTAAKSRSLGREVDVNLTIKLYKGVVYKALFGYFMTGQAAALLINGSNDSNEDAWELKQVVVVKF